MGEFKDRVIENLESAVARAILENKPSKDTTDIINLQPFTAGILPIILKRLTQEDGTQEQIGEIESTPPFVVAARALASMVSERLASLPANRDVSEKERQFFELAPNLMKLVFERLLKDYRPTEAELAADEKFCEALLPYLATDICRQSSET